jgi:hypothetical protein
MIIGNKDTRQVRIDDQVLDAGHNEFGWGENSAQAGLLALEVLTHFTDAHFAHDNYQDFVVELLCHKPAEYTLTLHEMTVVDWATRRGYSW